MSTLALGAGTVTDGPLVAALAVSAAAGLASFLSPCVLPLVPGYVSYVTGIAGADLDAALGSDPSGRPVPPAPAGGVAVAERTHARARVRGRVLAGSLLFVAGFTAVFTLLTFAVAGAGGFLAEHAPVLERVVGVVVVVLGLVFLGLVPGAEREFRVRRLPVSGLAGAPFLGAGFALGWIPCVSPTLGAVIGLSAVQGGAGRGVLLTVAYCLGLGVPFVLFGLGFRRLLGAFAVVRRHSRWVTRIGGGLLVVVGLLLVTGVWTDVVIRLRGLVGPGELWF